MKNNFGIKLETFSNFSRLAVFIQLPKYFIKQFPWYDRDAIKYFPKRMVLDYGKDKYYAEIRISRPYNEVLEVSIESIHKDSPDGLIDATNLFINAKDIQGVARMIRHNVYNVVKSFK